MGGSIASRGVLATEPSADPTCAEAPDVAELTAKSSAGTEGGRGTGDDATEDGGTELVRGAGSSDDCAPV